MTSYATLQGCRSRLRATTTADDNKLAGYIEKASARIDQWCGWIGFNEIKRTLKFTVRLGRRNLHLYGFGAPLLALTGLTNGDGTAIDSNNYTLIAQDNLYPYPYGEVELSSSYVWAQTAGGVVYEDPDGLRVNSSGYLIAPGAGDPIYGGYGRDVFARNAVQIAGLWGYVHDYDNAWPSTGLTIAGGGITASATSMTTSATIATALDVGDVIKAENETMLVTGPVAASTSSGMTGSTLTLKRGYNGSTAAAHNAGTVIYRWLTEPEIVLATELLAASYYAAETNPGGDRLYVEGLGAIQSPSKIPVKVLDTLNPFVNEITGRR